MRGEFIRITRAVTLFLTPNSLNAARLALRGYSLYRFSIFIECEVNLSVLLVPSPLFLTPNSLNAAR